jgi:uncharacterized OB-fold protein
VDVRPAFPLPDVTWEPARGFWEAAERGELSIPKCDGCGRLTWYPRERCRRCESKGFTWTPMSGRGTLFSWAVVVHPFLQQFADAVPFVPALVALEEDPAVRIVTRIVDCEPETLRFDLPVDVVFRPLEFTDVEGSVMAPMFRPVHAEGEA